MKIENLGRAVEIQSGIERCEDILDCNRNASFFNGMNQSNCLVYHIAEKDLNAQISALIKEYFNDKLTELKAEAETL